MIDMTPLPITTTLNALRTGRPPCILGWEKLLKFLGKTKADDEPLMISTILESNGLNDALWCLRKLPEEHYGRVCWMTCDFAERVLHLFEADQPDDHRPRVAIEMGRRFARGEVSEQEWIDAREAAHFAITEDRRNTVASAAAHAAAGQYACDMDMSAWWTRPLSPRNRSAEDDAKEDALHASLGSDFVTMTSYAAATAAGFAAFRLAAAVSADNGTRRAAYKVAYEAERTIHEELVVRYFG